MIIKRICLILALFVIGAATTIHAMEETATALVPTENTDEPVVATVELFPVEVWNKIAQELPGRDPFLNRLGRHIILDDSCYERIVAALLYEIEHFPTLEEIPHLINSYLKTTHSDKIDAKIQNAFVAFIRNHPLREYGANVEDISDLYYYVRVNPDNHLFSLAAINASSDSIADKNIHDLHEIRDKLKASIMYVRQIQRLIQAYSEKLLRNNFLLIGTKIYFPQLPPLMRYCGLAFTIPGPALGLTILPMFSLFFTAMTRMPGLLSRG